MFKGACCMATEKEMELAKQILEKVTAMEKKVKKLESSLGEINGELSDKRTSLASEVADLQNVNKGIQATFEQGFADVHKGLDEIREVNKNRWEGQKQKGQLN